MDENLDKNIEQAEETVSEEVTEAGANAAENAENTVEEAAENAENTVEEAAENAENAAEEAAENAENTVEEAAENAENAAEEAADGAEEAAESAEDIAESETEAISGEADGNGISDDLRQLQEDAEKLRSKPKKHKLMAPIIISCVIVAVAAVAALAVNLLFNRSIDGSWYYEQEAQMNYTDASSDEPKTVTIGYYFIFENGKLTVKSGSATGTGSYTYRKGEVEGEPVDEPVADLNFVDPVSSQPINQTMKVTLEGNIFTGQKLTLTSIQNEEFKLDFVKKDYQKPEIKREGTFRADKAAEGKWITSMKGYGVNYLSSYELRSDGTMTFTNTQQLDASFSSSGKSDAYTVSIDGIYSCENGKIVFNYVLPTNQKAEIPYSVKDNILTIIGSQKIDYYKAGTASADEAEKLIEVKN